VPDIVVVGGGIIGTACAHELARGGASVTLLEKDELAAGASGRNLGYLDTSKDPVLAPLASRSVERYAEIASDPPTPFFLDPEPLGTLAVTLDEDEVADLREWVSAARAVGVNVEQVDERVRELEPALSPDVLEAYLLHEGHRVDPLALTVCFGALARGAGASILHHTPARQLLERGDRIAGVVTDDAVVEADAVVLAAGPWSPAVACRYRSPRRGGGSCTSCPSGRCSATGSRAAPGACTRMSSSTPPTPVRSRSPCASSGRGPRPRRSRR
jgi:glycine/D-amino acid oxidase-like deaminating enzyme